VENVYLLGYFSAFLQRRNMVEAISPADWGSLFACGKRWRKRVEAKTKDTMYRVGEEQRV
jgi:hypothetical protein